MKTLKSAPNEKLLTVENIFNGQADTISEMANVLNDVKNQNVELTVERHKLKDKAENKDYKVSNEMEENKKHIKHVGNIIKTLDADIENINSASQECYTW